MIHNLTAGHFDSGGGVAKPLDMSVVVKLLHELGGTDGEGVPTLEGWKVRFDDGCVILPWKGGRTNRVAEEFALRLCRDTNCQLLDREHGREVGPGELVGLVDKATLAG